MEELKEPLTPDTTSHIRGQSRTQTLQAAFGSNSTHLIKELYNSFYQIWLCCWCLLFGSCTLSDLLILISGRDDHTMQILKSTDEPKIRQVPSDVMISPPPLPEICATPMPSPSEWRDLLPTWQPWPAHWLEDTNLTGIRFKLFQKGVPDTILEFVGVEGDEARV